MDVGTTLSEREYMQTLEQEHLEQEQKYCFNNEPVYYCAHCLSLKIKEVNGMEFCDNCSSTDIMTSSISECEELYEFKYGHKFIQ